MGRPNKNTVEYFPHYVKPGKTIYILEQLYGNNGYTFWFKLLEVLAHTENHFYDCRNPLNWEFMLSITHVDETSANNILDTLSKLGKIDADLWKNRIIWCQNLVNNLEAIYKKRSSEIPNKPGFLIPKPDLDTVSGTETLHKPDFRCGNPSVTGFPDTETNSREENSKGEKSKGEKTGPRQKKSENVFPKTEKKSSYPISEYYEQKIISLFKKILPDLKITDNDEWGPPYREFLYQLFREKTEYQNPEYWENLFLQIKNESPFLQGRKKKFQATLGWIIIPDNFKKVISGDYFEQNSKLKKKKNDPGAHLLQKKEPKFTIQEYYEINKRHEKEIDDFIQRLKNEEKHSEMTIQHRTDDFIRELGIKDGIIKVKNDAT